ncbi:MAG: protein kinase [Candidatus Thiothrix singaporensis]|uniref:Protein kinase n=1 Tax=Candidatus Thiothrix singaporensis TaxID=2799669 RepID=A0A7L6AWJ0_9GAMM|nr:MAG: protein kinase [Candidatus Thiothrix singaporensis]
MAEALTVLRQVGGALAHAHERGLIHRDIKPANILFRASGEAVLTDFGISKLQDTDSDLTRHGYAMLGTPRYMSPEQTGAQRLDRRSDIYSLALVFYEMLEGKAAIRADTVAQIIREHALAPPPVLPERYAFLQAVLDKALAKQPEERYSNVPAFLQAVEQSLAAGEADKTVILPPTPAAEPAAKRGMRPRYLLPLLLLPAGAGWWFWAGGKTEQQAPPMVTQQAVPDTATPVEEVEAQTPPPPAQPEPAAPQELAAVPVQPVVEQKAEPLEIAAAPAQQVVEQASAAPQAMAEAPVQPTVEPVAQPAAQSLTLRVRVSPYAVLYRQPGSNERIGEIAQGAAVTVLGSTTGRMPWNGRK